MKLYCKLIVVAAAILMAACEKVSPTSAIQTVGPEPTTAMTLATHTLGPTVVPTSAATATPSIPFPITWTVQKTTTADGRTVYVVDDPDVVRSAQEGYERLRDYYTFPQGLPTQEQIEQDLSQLIVDPDRLRGAVEQIEQIRSKGGYWILPPLAAYQWTALAEFNEDGSQVSLTLTAQKYHAEFFNLTANQVTFTEDDQGFNVEVIMVYDEFTGVWKLLSEKSSFAQRGPVITVTPTP